MAVSHSDVSCEVGGCLGCRKNIVCRHGVFELWHIDIFGLDAHAAEVLQRPLEGGEHIFGDAFHGLFRNGDGCHFLMAELELGLYAGGGVVRVASGDDGEVFPHLLGVHREYSHFIK